MRNGRGRVKGKKAMRKKRRIITQTIGKAIATDLIGSGAGVQTGGVRGSGGRLLGSCEVRGVMRALPQGMEEPGRLLGGARRMDGHQYRLCHTPPYLLILSMAS